MLLLRKDKITAITENGLMLAAFDFAQYSNASHQLEAGDRILLYTDGIAEAANPSGEFLGHEALGELLQRTAVLQPAEAANRIMSSMQRWSATHDDDLTVLLCDYRGVA
jgi:sigma-B regulation protein RsbU (phosphoserine phosphatase)